MEVAARVGGDVAKGGEAMPKEVVKETPIPDVIEERRKDQDGRVVSYKYLRGKLLGKGGFAKCFLGTSLQSKTQYALKIVAKSTLVKPRAKQKLQTEIKIHKTLHHLHVVRFDRFFEDHHNAYMLLELCANNSMSELLKRRKKLTEFETRYYLAQLVSALKYLHAHLVIHRDLKLGNLFIDAEMRIKVGDFGLATRLSHVDERKKTICGTPNYIAPEILEGKDGHSFEVDVWSTGVIMYTLLVGKPPFEAKDVKSTYKRILGNQYTFPDHTPVCDHAKSLIRHMLQARAERRPSLDQILEHSFFTRPSAFMPAYLTETALRDTPLLSEVMAARPPVGPITHNIVYPEAREQRPVESKAAQAQAHAQVGDENDPHAINRHAQQQQQHGVGRPLSSQQTNNAALASLAKKPTLELQTAPPVPARPKTAPVSVPSSSSSSSSAASQPAVLYSQSDADEVKVVQPMVRRSSRLVQSSVPAALPTTTAQELKPLAGRLGSSRATGPEKGYAHKFEIYQDSKATAGQGRESSVPQVRTVAAAAPSRPAADDIDNLQRGMEGVRLEEKTMPSAPRHAPVPVASSSAFAPPAKSEAWTWDDEEAAPLGKAPLGPVQSTPAITVKDGSKPLDTLETMHQMLNQSFTDIDKATRWVPDTARSVARVWVVRYVDYTSKYGLGFLLNTGSAGVYFNDSTKIVLSADGTVFQYIERRRRDGGAASEHVSQTHLMTAYPMELQKKVTLLRHFRNYLVDQHKSQAPSSESDSDLPVDAGQNMPMVLPEGASSGASTAVPFGMSSAVYECSEAERNAGLVTLEEGSSDLSMPFLKKWVRTRHAILFRLSNRTVQVVFFDRSEVLLSSEARVITYVNKQGAREEHSLEDVLHTGRSDIAKRLRYTKDIMARLLAGGGATK